MELDFFPTNCASASASAPASAQIFDTPKFGINSKHACGGTGCYKIFCAGCHIYMGQEMLTLSRTPAPFGEFMISPIH